MYSSILTTANYIFPLLTFPYVSRVLGVTNFGIVNFVDSVINYFVLFSMMGISVIGIREIAKNKNEQESLNKAFSSLFLLNSLTTFCALIGLLIATFTIPQLFTHWKMMLIGALKLILGYMLIDWLYKGLEKFRYITMRTIVVKSLFVLSVFLFVREQNDYTTFYLLTALMVVINSLINLFHSRLFVRLRFHGINIRTYLKPYFILGVYLVLTSMYTTFNVAYLGFVSGETEVGYYTTASKLHNILIALFTAFTGVTMPRMSSLLAEGKTHEFKVLLAKSNNILFTFTFPLVIFSIAYAPTIIKMIAGNGYEGAILPMRIMMPLILIIGYEQILVVQTLIPLKKDNVILRNSIAGSLVGIFLNIGLVYYYRSVGSSIVWFCAEMAVLVSAQYYVTNSLHYNFPWRVFLRQLLLNCPLVFLIIIIMSGIENEYISMSISSLVSVIYFFLANLFFINNIELRNLILSGVCYLKKYIIVKNK